MRNTPLRAFAKKSPVYKTYDFNKKTKDYSPKATKGTIGDKLAKAVTPKNTLKGMASAAVPVGKAVKAGKAMFNYFKGDKKA